MDLDFIISPFLGGSGKSESAMYRYREETEMKAWKKHLIEVLEDSPSKERKFLRWRVYETQEVVEEGELEVLPGTSL